MLVSAQVVLAASTTAQGRAAVPLPIPSSPVLAGRPLFAQWLQVPAWTFVVSAGAAVHIEP
jgi:hypothetical protein